MTAAVLALAAAPLRAPGQVSTTLSFAEVGAGLTGVEAGSASSADFDGDGDPDVVITGSGDDNPNIPDPQAIVYENQDTDGILTSDDFQSIGGNLVPVSDFSSNSLGDLDGDGDPDLLITGEGDTDGDGDLDDRIARVYRNDDADSDLTGSDFVQVAAEENSPLEGVTFSASVMGDLDEDGDPDLIVTGKDDDTNRSTRVYENTNSNGEDFTNGDLSLVDMGLPDLTTHKLSLGDLDGDGGPDLLITGETITRVYENTTDGGSLESGNFVAVLDQNDDSPLTSVDAASSSAMGDPDGDGDPDLLYNGRTVEGTTFLFENTDTDGVLQAGDFVEVGNSFLTGIKNGTTAITDLDGNGTPDLLLAGYSEESSWDAIIYKNSDTDGTLEVADFSTANVGLTGVNGASSTVADFDRDGDTDLVVAGLAGGGGGTTNTTVYENTSSVELTLTDADGDDSGVGDGEDAGWRMLAFPSATTVAELEANFNYDFQNDIRSGEVAWIEEGSAAWTALTRDSDEVAPGQGMILFFFDDSADPIDNDGFTLSVPGVGNASSDRTRSGLDDSQFLLLGNPYATAFNLSSLVDPGTADFSDNFQSTVQVWDPESESYTTLTRGTDNVPAMQGFFVERKNPGRGPSSLEFRSGGVQAGITGDFDGDGAGTKSALAGLPAGREGENAAAEGPLRARMELTVEPEEGDALQDGMSTYFAEGASAGWDAFEATQLAPPFAESYVTLSSPTLRVDTLARRTQASRPVPTDTAEVPLSARAVGTGGTATVQVTEALPAEWTLRFKDRAIGTTVDLRETGYTFDLAAGDGQIEAPSEARFRLQVIPSAAIPVELASFKAAADGEEVRLTWQTASETNNAGFEVQRRVDEGERGGEGAWGQIGWVEGAGTTSNPQSYRFADESVPYSAETLRYRLKQVDTDGTTHLGKEIEVTLGTPTDVTLRAPFPNPAQRQATIRYALPEASDVRITVYDVLGRRVRILADGKRTAGRKGVRLSTKKLSSGTYFLQLQAGREVQTRRLRVLR